MSERQMATRVSDIKADHVSRYILARNLIDSDQRILDAGCGCGYGSSILGEVARRVVGVDIDQKTINHAATYFGTEGIRFLQRDLVNVDQIKMEGWDTKPFHTIVCFEAIEHVVEDLRLLQNLRKMGKRLICSVPNEDRVKWSKETHPWHFRHYTLEEITRVLEEAGWVLNAFYGAAPGMVTLNAGYLGSSIIMDCS